MKIIRTIAIAAAAFGLALTARAATAPAERPRPLLYVANASGEVTAYDPGSSGVVLPATRIAGEATRLGSSWAIAFDLAADLFVQNFGGQSQTVVFAPNIIGNVAPLRFFSSSTGARDAPSLAIDSKGNVYVARLTSVPILEVFPPNASGDALPSRSVTLDGFPTSVTIDHDDNVIVGLLNTPTGNAIEVFAASAQGSAQPLRRISGPATGLGSGSFYTGAFLVVNYSPFTNRIYAAPSGDFDPTVVAHISVFAVDASGNIAPVRSISGPSTLLGETIMGLAGDQETGEIFALSVNSKLATPAMIHVYARLAHGDVSPLRSFTDAISSLQSARGIAFVPPQQ